jgi:hypothetical protein
VRILANLDSSWIGLSSFCFIPYYPCFSSFLTD